MWTTFIKPVYDCPGRHRRSGLLAPNSRRRQGSDASVGGVRLDGRFGLRVGRGFHLFLLVPEWAPLWERLWVDAAEGVEVVALFHAVDGA